ncbi:MAG: N-acetyltransferase [Candidatus Scalindua sp. AMX11]|nr:MAG: N-acetyltransferase [Candidatus Scalindua sp.]NOG82541.1 GNAT family N-acetyltransferase [Planctomycetota bacterium]RZV93970.1 MAG: N-acetyltransferase [Candidatus Scalindua sp. SCAELEC01]TDE63987.1 MAG: N-acetyltransferase [Candidatus Scalindua sp. AMX11]GJQ58178.1 MAG: hypothetical protein SCALA701_09790 [Candidatus Scalindua sp.]
MAVRLAMHYRTAVSGDYKDIRAFLTAQGWIKHIDEQSFCQMLENSDRTVVALDGSRIVGFGRALCDNVSIGYLSAILVSDDKRGHGIGRKMVKILMGSDPHIKWVITCGKKSFTFWEKLGFRHTEHLMERSRTIDRTRTIDKTIRKNIAPPTMKKRIKKFIKYVVVKPKDLVMRKLYSFFNE